MGIITKGMGAIMKGAKKRKTLTISVPKKSTDVNPFKQKRRNIHGWKRKVEWPTKKDKDRFSEAVKREVVIKKKSKPSKTKLADTWQDRRIDAMNRKIKKSRVDLPRIMLKKLRIFIDLKLLLKKFIKVFKRNSMH